MNRSFHFAWAIHSPSDLVRVMPQPPGVVRGGNCDTSERVEIVKDVFAGGAEKRNAIREAE